jgi:hypothetical protein
MFVSTLDLGAGEVAGRLKQLHEGEVKVEGGNDPAHLGVQAQGFFLHRVQGPDIRCWVRLTRGKKKSVFRIQDILVWIRIHGILVWIRIQIRGSMR